MTLSLSLAHLHKYPQVSCAPHSKCSALLERLADAADLISDLRANRDMASRVAALLLLSIICTGFVAAEVAMDCCLQKSDKYLPARILVDYRIQEAGQGCDISATVFVTKNGKVLCVSHPSDQTWVKKHITLLENRRN